MKYSIQHIIAQCNGKGQLTFPQDEIDAVSIDSRKIKNGVHTLFVALSSANRDGHDYLGEAARAGCRNFLVQRIPAHAPEGNYVRCEAPLVALQALATAHRKAFDIPVVGITGSNGKTIVKEWLYQLLSEKFQVVRSPGSYNSQIGVPLSVLQINAAHELGIFEAGISQPEEMKKLAPIIQCNIGIFTNIGDAHADGFKNQEEKLLEKIKLFPDDSSIVYCVDHKSIHTAIAARKCKKIAWSLLENEAAYSIKITAQKNNQSSLNVTGPLAKWSVIIPFTDPASIENYVHAMVCARHLGLPVEALQKASKSLESLAMRLSLHPGRGRNLLIQDYYNADLHGLQVALDFMDQQAGALKRVLIISQLLGGNQDKKMLSTIARLVTENKVSTLVGIGQEIVDLKKHLPQSIAQKYYSSTDLFLENQQALHFSDSIILLKGSRQFAFEKIFSALSGMTHRVRLEVNLSALKNNLDQYKNRITGSAKIMAMVKASAYGSGSIEVSKWLEREKVDHLCVAYPDEGIQLREAGIQLPIMVLNPAIDKLSDLVRYELEPEVYSMDLLQALLPHAQQLRGIHLKLDTGMHRLGFLENEWPELAKILASKPELKVLSIFSHLAASELREQDDFSHAQAQRLEKGYQLLLQSLDYHPLKHLLNSNGILRFPQYHYDMVRLGMGLYGYAAAGLMDSVLQPIFSLKGQLVQIKALLAGESVGYVRAGRPEQDTEIGIVNIGYADGLLRKAGNGRFQVSIAGHLYPTIGNVCMDMCMVDLGLNHGLKTGETVTIFSDQVPISRLAEALETIPYEVLTNISSRVSRIYIQD